MRKYQLTNEPKTSRYKPEIADSNLTKLNIQSLIHKTAFENISHLVFQHSVRAGRAYMKYYSLVGSALLKTCLFKIQRKSRGSDLLSVTSAVDPQSVKQREI